MTNMKESDTAMKRDLEQIKKNVTEVKDLENVQKNDTALHKGFEDIKEKNAVLKRKLEGIKESVTDVKKDLANLKENNDAVKIDLEDIKNNITAVKRDLDVLKETYTSVKGDLEDIKENVSEVKKGLENVKVNDTAVKKDLEDVKENVTAVKNDLDDIKENVNEVKKDNKDIKENVTEVNKNLECIKENVNEVGKDLEEVKENDTAVKRDIEDIKENVTEVKKDLHVVTENVTEVKKNLYKIKIRQWKKKSNKTDSSIQTEERKYQNYKKDLKDGLIEFYKTRHSKIFLSPLFEEKDTPLASFYIRPELSSTVSTSTENDEKIPIKSLSEIFRFNNTENREIYVLAEAGLGKSAFSKYLANVWCQAHYPDKNMCNFLSKDDVDCMKRFDFLFLVILQDSGDLCSIDDLIFEKNVSCLGLEEKPSENILLKVLKTEKCLVILDGLDEWTHPDKKCYRSPRSIPHRNDRKMCTVLTTTRPWKLAVSKLNSRELGKIVEISKLSKDATGTLTRRILQRLKSHPSENTLQNDVTKFMEEINSRKIAELTSVPLHLIYSICLWCDGVHIGNSKCGLYVNIVELLLTRTIQKHGELEQSREVSSSDIPECFAEYYNCRKYYPLLMHIGKLAYFTLFSETKKNTLVFDGPIARKYLPTDEMKITLHSGILSESTSKSLTKKFSKVSFSHKTVQEFFAAIFISSQSVAQTCVLEKCRNIQDILDMSIFFEFISKMNADLMCAISNGLMSVINEDEITRDYRTRIGVEFLDNPLFDIQDLFLLCLQEMPESGNIQLCLQDFFIHMDTVRSEQLQRLLKPNKTNIKSLYINISNTFSTLRERDYSYSTTDLSYTFSSLREIINFFSLTDASHIQKLFYCGESREETEINLILFPSLKYLTVFYGTWTNNEENLSENLPRLQNLQYLYIDDFTVSHKILQTFFTFISDQISMKGLKLRKLDCKERHHRRNYFGHEDHYCKTWNLDLSQHSTLKMLNLSKLPDLQLKIATSSLVNVTLADINLDENSLLLSRDMLSIKRVNLEDIEMSTGGLKYFMTELQKLPQSVTVKMAAIKPRRQYDHVIETIRKSPTFHVLADNYYHCYSDEDDNRERNFEFKTINNDLRQYLERFYSESATFYNFYSDLEGSQNVSLRICQTFRKLDITNKEVTVMNQNESMTESLQMHKYPYNDIRRAKPILLLAKDTTSSANFIVSSWLNFGGNHTFFPIDLNNLEGVFLLKVRYFDDASDLKTMLKYEFEMKNIYYSQQILVIFEYFDKDNLKLKAIYDLACYNLKTCSFIIITNIDKQVVVDLKLNIEVILIADAINALHVYSKHLNVVIDGHELSRRIDQIVSERKMDAITKICFEDIHPINSPAKICVPEDIKDIRFHRCSHTFQVMHFANHLEISEPQRLTNPLTDNILTPKLTTLTIHFESPSHIFYYNVYEHFACKIFKANYIEFIRLCDMSFGKKVINVQLQKEEIEQIRRSVKSKEDYCRFGARILGPRLGKITFDKEDIEIERSNSFVKQIMLDLICYELVKTHSSVSECYPSEINDGTILLICFVNDELQIDSFNGFRLLKRYNNYISKESLLAGNACGIEENTIVKAIEDDFKDINETLSFHAKALMTSHRNLEAAKVSFVKRKDKELVPSNLCIVLYCKAKGYIPFGDVRFPRTLNHPLKNKSFRTDVREGSFSTCHFRSGHSTDFNKTLVLGSSIGEVGGNLAATLGPFVNIKETNTTCFLTARHVFGPISRTNESVNGVNVVQPADVHLIPCAVGLPNRHCGIVIVSQDRGQIDASLVRISPERLPTSGQFIQLTKEDLDFAGLTEQPKYNDGKFIDAKTLTVKDLATRRIIKIGCRTSLTKGTLSTTDGCVRETVKYSTLETLYNGSKESFEIYSQIMVDSYYKKVFTQAGDSGSGVFLVDDNNSLHCIGMLIGVCSDMTAVVTPINNILQILGNKMGKPLELKKFRETEEMDES